MDSRAVVQSRRNVTEVTLRNVRDVMRVCEAYTALPATQRGIQKSYVALLIQQQGLSRPGFMQGFGSVVDPASWDEQLAVERYQGQMNERAGGQLFSYFCAFNAVDEAGEVWNIGFCHCTKRTRGRTLKDVGVVKWVLLGTGEPHLMQSVYYMFGHLSQFQGYVPGSLTQIGKLLAFYVQAGTIQWGPTDAQNPEGGLVSASTDAFTTNAPQMGPPPYVPTSRPQIQLHQPQHHQPQLFDPNLPTDCPPIDSIEFQTWLEQRDAHFSVGQIMDNLNVHQAPPASIPLITQPPTTNPAIQDQPQPMPQDQFPRRPQEQPLPMPQSELPMDSIMDPTAQLPPIITNIPRSAQVQENIAMPGNFRDRHFNRELQRVEDMVSVHHEVARWQDEPFGEWLRANFFLSSSARPGLHLPLNKYLEHIRDRVRMNEKLDVAQQDRLTRLQQENTRQQGQIVQLQDITREQGGIIEQNEREIHKIKGYLKQQRQQDSSSRAMSQAGTKRYHALDQLLDIPQDPPQTLDQDPPPLTLQGPPPQSPHTQPLQQPQDPSQTPPQIHQGPPQIPHQNPPILQPQSPPIARPEDQPHGPVDPQVQPQIPTDSDQPQNVQGQKSALDVDPALQNTQTGIQGRNRRGKKQKEVPAERTVLDTIMEEDVVVGRVTRNKRKQVRDEMERAGLLFKKQNPTEIINKTLFDK